MDTSGILAAIVRFSLRYRGVVIALACLLFLYGLYTLPDAKFDVFPEFAPPQTVIQTEAMGLSAEQVEILVTQPIENVINGAPGIQALRSSSIQGLSVITVVFQPGSDIYHDRQVIAERLTTARLPQGVRSPIMSPMSSSTSVALTIGLTSDKHTLMELRTIADWTLKPDLLAVSGVSNVAVFGGEEKQIQIQVSPEKLVRYDLSIDEVLASARKATGIKGAGVIDNANQRIVLQSEGQSLDPSEIAATVVAHRDGANIVLGDVARVVDAPATAIGAASVMNKPAVQLVISEQYGTNTQKVTEHIEQELKVLAPGLLAQGIVLHTVFRPANFIRIATRNMTHSLIIGAILVIMVLTLFLLNLRAAAISLTAIPLSLLAASMVMEYQGLSFNTMTLGGLAIAIGLLVDDAVIVVENIYRRLRENHHLDTPRPPFNVILNATLEVRSAVVYATLAIALVFTPVLSMSGVAGRLFSPLSLAYILATLASLAVAITVTPALCMLLLGNHALPEYEPPIVRWLKTRYRSLLLHVERHFRSIAVFTVIATLAGMATLPFMEGEFLPELKEGHFIVHMAAVPGTSLTESMRIGHNMMTDLLKLPIVNTIAQRAGRAEKADDTYGTQYSEIDVELKPLDENTAGHAQSDIRKAMALFPGVATSVKTFLVERIEETLSGYTASVVVNVYGKNLDNLDEKAQQIAKILNRISGAAEVQVQSPPGMPQILVKLHKDALTKWGFDSVQVLDAVRTAFQGDIVGQVYDGNRVFDVDVILDPKERRNILDVGSLPLRNSTGTYVGLNQLADIREAPGRYIILHDGARRVQTVTCNVSDRDVGSFVAEARKQIATKVSLPIGSYVEFGGTAEAQARTMHDLLMHSAIAVIAIVLLLSMVLRNPRNLILIFINLPFALIGGVLAVLLSDAGLSVGSLVGFITLFGITLRNSIMMLSHYEHLVAEAGLDWGPETALRGAQERLAPILMTALVTALGLLPLALGSNAPGREVEGPMAIVILGGLFTSTALNLLLLPSLALRYGRFRRPTEDS
ncbi:MAG: efflux RND transporter permease subunit [Burkholderiales bacterium]